MMTLPRSNYATRLTEFPTIAFADVDAFARRGRWRTAFSEQIGEGFDGRIVFEIGCSDAGMLATVAAKNPTTAFVGLDWKFKAVYDGASRVAEAGLKNVALIRGRGQEIRRIFADGELSEIWVFHPDPCDREVELQNRLIRESFLLDAHRALADGPASVFALKTDHAGYYQWTLSLLGLPQPSWFAEEPQSDEQPAGTRPRIRPGDLMEPHDLPRRSEAAQAAFDVAVVSADFWNDPAAIETSASRAFAGVTTFFENRFRKKRLPIYYVELRKHLGLPTRRSD